MVLDVLESVSLLFGLMHVNYTDVMAKYGHRIRNDVS